MSMIWGQIVIGLFLISVLGVGIYHSRRITLNGFTLEKNRLGFLYLLGTFVGTSVGGGIVVGMVTMGYEGGVVGYIVGVSYFLGFVVLAFLARTIRKSLEGTPGTFLDFLENRLNKKIARLATVAFTLVLFFFLSAQYVALAAFLEFFFEVEFLLGLVLATIFLVTYTALGGFRSIIATDLLQLICIGLATIWLIRPVCSVGTIDSIAALPVHLLNGTAYGRVFLIGVAIFLWPSLLLRIDVWQRIAAAKNDAIARCSLIASGIVLLVFMLLYTTLGLAARAEYPDIEPRQAAFIFVQAKLHTVGVLVSFVGLLAAIMSSADSILNVLAICVVKLTRQGSKDEAWNGSDSSKGTNLLKALRLATVLLGAVSFGVAFAFPDIVELNVVGLSALLVFLPSVVMGLRQAPANTTAAFWSALIGIIAVLATIPFAPKIAFVPGIVLSGTTFGILIVIGKQRKPREVDSHG